MIFSRKTDYAIMLIDSLKRTYSSGEFLAISDIAEKNQISRMFLEKLAQELRFNKIFEARKGKGGGYRLIKNPKKISFLDIARIFEGIKNMQCVKYPRPNEACPLWASSSLVRSFNKLDVKINKIFAKTTF